jgi:ATP-dependent DNA ligase
MAKELNLDFDKSRLNCKHGDYCTGDAIHLADPSLHTRTQEYKRKLSGRMRPLSGQELHRIPEARGYYVTRKYDGEFTLIFFNGDKLISVNPGGTVRIGLPCYEEAEKLLKKNKVKSCVLAAEIYMKETTSKALPIQQVIRILRAGKTKAELEKLGLAVFDIVEFEGKPLDTTKKVFTLLDKWFGKGKLVHPVEYVVTDDMDKILELLTDWVIAEGSEGLVIRHDQAGMFKVKLRHNLDAAIIGFSLGSEDRKHLLHDLLVAVMRDDGTFQELARVGGGFTDEDRKTIADEMRRRIVPSDYVAVNNDYVAYEMVAPGPVIEISCLDMIAESARGGTVNRMVLSWDGKRYSALSRMPLVSLISPQFVRIRDDKEANVEDVNIRQISEMVSVLEVDKPAIDTASTPSKLLERVVYTKTMKGNQMVRKLLLWKTNKEDRPEYPSYVVYLTDFSPNRQNPLERDVRVSSDEETARSLFKEMAKNNFVGGWEKAGK